uniref:Interleukin-21 n=1 Tax=Gopherus evgoodei TaxID=1825980 RepID=A0A8C4WSU7_9SAUR
MERMIICCLFFFCSSMLLSAAAPTKLRYKELVKTVIELKKIVKVKDVEFLNTPEDSESKCLSSTFNCFQNASLHLEPANSQSSRNFDVMITRLRRPIIIDTITDNCSPCESYAKEAPRQFLDSFLSLLQEVINIHCS